MIRLSNRNLWVSVGLVAVSFLMPQVINVINLNIYPGLHQSIETSDQGLLIIVSLKLVIMNAVRILPVYMAAFSLIETMKDLSPSALPRYLELLGVMIVPLLYLSIRLILGIHYDFGITSVVVMLSILLLVNMDLSRISILKKSVFVILLLIGLQWVDIIPVLSDYGFGRGEVSYDVKQTIRFMQAERSVTFSAIMFFSFFMIMALMILFLLRDQNKALKSVEQKNQMQIEYRDLQLRSLKTRSLEEMQNLVHDLRSPLTSIQALASLSAMVVEEEKVQGYMNNINESVDQLNRMISEILHKDNKHPILIDALFGSILSQISSLEGSDRIRFRNGLKNGMIRVNRIRFSRMIFNLISNSLSALNKPEGIIDVNVSGKEMELVIDVIDNGRGIEERNLTRIRERGFSTKGSSGLGLRYVEDVAGNHGGRLFIESKDGVGTVVRLIFDKGSVGYEEDTDN